MAGLFACLKLKLAQLCVLVASASSAAHDAVMPVKQSKVCACWYCRCSTLTVCLAATSICASTSTTVTTDTTAPVITVLLNSLSVNATTSAGLLLVVTTVYAGRSPECVAHVQIKVRDAIAEHYRCYWMLKHTLCCKQPCLVEAACCLVLTVL